MLGGLFPRGEEHPLSTAVLNSSCPERAAPTCSWKRRYRSNWTFVLAIRKTLLDTLSEHYVKEAPNSSINKLPLGLLYPKLTK